MNSLPSSSASQAGGLPFAITPETESLDKKIENIKQCFALSIEPNFSNALNHGAPIAAMMIALTAIDFLASFYYGEDREATGYEGFVDKYLKPLVSKETRGYDSKILYRNLRCGLFHNYTTAKTPSKDFQSSDLIYMLITGSQRVSEHLTLLKGSQNRMIFHIQVFFDHVIRAKDQYFRDMEGDSDLKALFEKWYAQTGYLSEIDLSQLLNTGA